MVDIQVVLPDESPATPPEQIIELGVAAEALGFETAWLPDHLLPPAPYGRTYGGVYEPLVTLTYLAARTTRIRLGTSVLVLPMRNPFVVAKQAATLHRLSGGRLTLGVGIGWDRTEFASVGADFGTRGARTDEAIRLLRHLFAGGGAFGGVHYGYDDGIFEPALEEPVPIMVGGTSQRALERVAALADEWQGFALEPVDFAARVQQLRELTDRPIRVGTRIAAEDHASAAVDRVAELAEAGADAVAVWFGDADGFAERMAGFAVRAGTAAG